ncbi:hypothetical protein NPIL_457501 [Nephila pilipes]|uniref:Uncharacterized protein n=1 Tax=Nephila pilipes TaxID=299642 RepID=A0A8X6T8A0_NEPPI|nr:hypothetical protein NPIL_457501 [Nephila pilipes]
MDVFVTFAESFIAGNLPMEWQTTEVHVEEMEWECSDLDEPMDWEDIPEVRCAKKSKVSKRINNVTFQHTSTPAAPMEVSKPVISNTSFQVKKTTPEKKKVSPPVDDKENSSLQVTPTPPDPKKVSALAYYESIRRKIRSKPKVSPPQHLIGRTDEGGGFFKITEHVTQQKWQRWSTPSHQRTVKAPPVAERRSSSNWKMKNIFVYVLGSSSGWLRGVYLVPPRVARMWAGYPLRPPGRHPVRSTIISKLPTFRCWKSVFSYY